MQRRELDAGGGRRGCDGRAGRKGLPSCGLTAGCPAATDWLALLMSPWLFEARAVSDTVTARAYVDDLTAWAKGAGCVEVVGALVALAEKFEADADLRIHRGKTRGFATDPAAAVELALLGSLEVDGAPVPPPTPIAWYPGRLAWRFDVSRSVLRGKGVCKTGGVETSTQATLSGFHHFLMAETELGTISRQEEVSMVPPCLLDVRPGQRVIDMCASPGSKTQQVHRRPSTACSLWPPPPPQLPGEASMEARRDAPRTIPHP